jgi:hypothetical protein
MSTGAISDRPRRGVLVALLLLAAHIAWRAHEPLPPAQAGFLPAPPPLAVARAASLGEPVALAGLATLWLQSVGDAPGAATPFAQLDYVRLEAWLDTLLALDPFADAPLLLASHVFSQVPDPDRVRRMLAFTRRAFAADPDRRWRWLTHAALIAKHRLNDTPLALDYARAVASHTHSPPVPHWARQMPIFLLEELGEVEAARMELSAWLASGSVTDPAERRFLGARLLELETAETSPPPSRMRHSPQPHR